MSFLKPSTLHPVKHDVEYPTKRKLVIKVSETKPKISSFVGNTPYND